MKFFDYLQKVAKSLMMPVIVLPAATLFLRLGSSDLLGQFIGNGTNDNVLRGVGAIAFDHLPLIFAVGVSIGIANDGHGTAVLAAILAFFIIETVGHQWAEWIWNYKGNWEVGTIGGIVAGIVAGEIHNRFKDFQLPDVLGFFAGQRFVPLVTLAVTFGVAGIFGLIWPTMQNGLEGFYGIIKAMPNYIQGGVHVTTERLLLPIGLHHIWNAIVLFAKPGGDFIRFIEQDGGGSMMVGKFVLNMFAIPAIGLALISVAKPENKRKTKSIVYSGILVAFITGITEPIEFLFLWIAPFLYVFYAILAGVFGAITSAIGALHGFGFSASLIDFFLNYGIATNPWYPMLIGIIAAPIFYFSFRFLILKYNIQTLGRGDNKVEEVKVTPQKNKWEEKAKIIVKALGGKANIVTITSCATRLRAKLKDSAKVDVNLAKSAGAIAVTKPTKTSCQVIIGPNAQFYMNEISKLIK